MIVFFPVEEESSENGSMSHGLSSARSSVSSEHATNDDHHRKLKQKSKEKKSGGIFKGLFRSVLLVIIYMYFQNDGIHISDFEKITQIILGQFAYFVH